VVQTIIALVESTVLLHQQRNRTARSVKSTIGELKILFHSCKEKPQSPYWKIPLFFLPPHHRTEQYHKDTSTALSGKYISWRMWYSVGVFGKYWMYVGHHDSKMWRWLHANDRRTDFSLTIAWTYSMLHFSDKRCYLFIDDKVVGKEHWESRSE